jgi:hypothetical protein
MARCPELQSVNFPAAFGDNSFLMAVDASAVSLSGGKMQSVGRPIRRNFAEADSRPVWRNTVVFRDSAKLRRFDELMREALTEC